MGCATSAPEIKIDDPKKSANKADPIAPTTQVSIQVFDEISYYRKAPQSELKQQSTLPAGAITNAVKEEEAKNRGEDELES